MNKTQDSWADYWARTRKTGITVFLLKRGTVLGLIMFGTLVMAPRIFLIIDDTGFPIVPLGLFMLLGYVLATALWWANERSYEKQLESAKNEKTTGEIND